MSSVKERIIGAVTIMDEKDAAQIWNIILTTFAQREWADIREELPDEIDLSMLAEIEKNPDCRDFVSSAEAMKILGLNEMI
jgi:hypothetical protein